MRVVIDEGALRFEFDESWEDAVKWDESTAYRGGIGRLDDTKAVDLLGLAPGVVCLVEVKDFRGHRIENKERLVSGELQREVAQKVRDTLAGVLGAARAGGDAERWKPYAKALVSAGGVRVVLWLEEDFTPPPGDGVASERWRARLSAIQNLLKQRLRWLTPQVLVTSVREASGLPGVRVRYLPRK